MSQPTDLHIERILALTHGAGELMKASGNVQDYRTRDDAEKLASKMIAAASILLEPEPRCSGSVGNDAEFVAKVEASMGDTQPSIPHDHVMAEMDEIIAAAERDRKAGAAGEDQGCAEAEQQCTGAGSLIPSRKRVMTGNNFPKSIIKALGLPGVVQEFHLHAKKHALVEVECRYIPFAAED